MALLGATAKEYGEHLGEHGVVKAMVIAFAIDCLICLALLRWIGNPSNLFVTGLFVGMGAGAVAEAAGLNDSETWRLLARYAIFFSAYFLWVVFVVPKVTGRTIAGLPRT